MKRETLFFLAIITIWIWMIIRVFFWWENGAQISDQDPWIIDFTWDTLSGSTDHTWGTATSPSTWTISIQTGSSAINTWNNMEESSEITIMMPKYFYNTGRNIFIQNLYTSQKIHTNVILIDDLNLYRDNLSNPEFSGADLFLFPYDRKDIIKTRTFSFEKNIAYAFDQLIAPILKDIKIWFLPFSADPMIMYSTADLEQNNFSEISNLVYTRQPKIQLAFPIFFWITSEDYNNKWFDREYQDIVRYALMHYFKKYQDSNYLWMRVNTNILNNAEIKNYNVWDLDNISNTITRPECKIFPSICFQLYNFVGIRFGFLSDQDIVDNYFSHKKTNFEKTSKTAMPFSSIEEPVRIRWRWINGNLENPYIVNNIYQFLIQYMNKHNIYSLRNSTLPVFKDESNPLSNDKYIWLRWYVMDSGWDYVDTLRNSSPFRDLIDYRISAKDYLRKS